MNPTLHDFVLQVADCLKSGCTDQDIVEKLKGRLDLDSCRLLIEKARLIISKESETMIEVPAETAESIGAFREDALSEEEVKGAVFENGDEYESN